MAGGKTNAMRILEKEKVPYQVHTYQHDDGLIDGMSIASKLGQDPSQVYKTLVTQGVDHNYFVFVLPVNCELNLKAAAKAVGEKSVAMIPVADINKVTGYIRGGCSPVGMKKSYPTVIHSACQNFSTIMVSAGKIGMQVELDPQNLIRLLGCKTADITMKE